MAEEQFPAAETALKEYRDLEMQMADPDVVSNPDKIRKLGRRHAELGAIVSAYTAYLRVRDDLEAAREMAGEDADFAEEAKRLENELPQAEDKLRNALIPRDPDDARDTIMEIKAGTGGEEAAADGNGSNDGDYKNPKFDDLMTKAYAAQSTDDANKLYQQAQEILLNDLPAIPLYYSNAVAVTSLDVQGFEMNWQNVPIYENLTLSK